MFSRPCHTPLKPTPQQPRPEPGDIPVDPDSDMPRRDSPLTG
ncbi:hypothetical protein [Bordetella genomosp. 12]|nr:hypothetical protein [Bordetella genomosp. 12]